MLAVAEVAIDPTQAAAMQKELDDAAQMELPDGDNDDF